MDLSLSGTNDAWTTNLSVTYMISRLSTGPRTLYVLVVSLQFSGDGTILKHQQQRTPLRQCRVEASLTQEYRETSCGVSELMQVTATIQNTSLIRLLAKSATGGSRSWLSNRGVSSRILLWNGNGFNCCHISNIHCGI